MFDPDETAGCRTSSEEPYNGCLWPMNRSSIDDNGLGKSCSSSTLFPRLPQYDQRGSLLPRAEKLSNQRPIDTDSRTVLCRGSALVMEIQSACFARLKASRRVTIGRALGCAGVSDKRSLTDRMNAATTQGGERSHVQNRNKYN